MATNILNAVLKRWGAASTKRRIWDAEYKSGKWHHLDPNDRAEAQRDLIYKALERYSEAASILDLGCGTASTAVELRAEYASYLGVDISEIAIEQATKVIKQDLQRSLKARFEVSDILRFGPEGTFNVILFRECLYYFPRYEVKTMLEHYSRFLAPGGVFIVRFHDRRKYESLVSLIEREYEVAERLAPASATEVVLVFRPRKHSASQENA